MLAGPRAWRPRGSSSSSTGGVSVKAAAAGDGSSNDMSAPTRFHRAKPVPASRLRMRLVVIVMASLLLGMSLYYSSELGAVLPLSGLRPLPALPSSSLAQHPRWHPPCPSALRSLDTLSWWGQRQRQPSRSRAAAHQHWHPRWRRRRWAGGCSAGDAPRALVPAARAATDALDTQPTNPPTLLHPTAPFAL